MKDILHPLVKQFMPFAQKRMGFDKPPRLFLRNDPENAQNPLGKTAYYDPEQMSVTLYINGRHPKDIMRSLSHELVHHTQNCNGQFDDIGELGEGYAQNDDHLREMERQAYEQGNLCFRDWEDSIKGTIYIQNMNVNIQKEGKNKMSLNDWKNNELKTLLSEKWGFSFNLLNESQEEAADDETLNEEEDDELEEGAASSGRAVTPDRGGEDRRAGDERKRPMEEAEEKGKYDDGDGKDEKCDHVPCKDQDKKEKMDERNYLDTMGGADMKLNDKQKEQLGYLLAKRGEKLSLDPVKRKRQINYYIKMLDNRAKEKLDQTPAYMDKDDDKPAIRMMSEQKIRRIIRKLVKEAVAKKAR